MSAIDTAKEIAKIAVTSGLSTEIIGLLEKKITLLTEQVTALDAENKNLKAKVYDLEQELSSLRPKADRLQEGTERLLQLLFQHDEMTVGEAAALLGCSRGMADYHRGTLMDAGMAVWTRIGIQTDFGESEGAFCVTHEGREYAVKHGLAK
jgi:FtsZ-binding cell division protein ZapB